jgi:hypothetical protein
MSDHRKGRRYVVHMGVVVIVVVAAVAVAVAVAVVVEVSSSLSSSREAHLYLAACNNPEDILGRESSMLHTERPPKSNACAVQSP